MALRMSFGMALEPLWHLKNKYAQKYKYLKQKINKFVTLN
jgi:hypothetical protein